MADYYTLLQRAISGLPESTPETRGAIYERARTVLVQQLRNVEPPLPEADIDREYAALDHVIARIEAEARPLEEAAWPEDNWPDQENLHAFEQVPEPDADNRVALDDHRAADYRTRMPPGAGRADPAAAEPETNGSPGRERPRLAPARPKRDMRSRLRKLTVTAVLAIVIAAIAGVAVILRDRPLEITRETQPTASQEQGEGKFADRLGGEPAPAPSQPAPAATPPSSAPASTANAPSPQPAPAQSPGNAVPVAQRATLYAESPDNPQAPR